MSHVRTQKRTVLSDQVATVIGKNTSMKGVLTASVSLRIDGEFEGEVTTSADFVVGDTASVKAFVVTLNAVVAGNVKGNMVVGNNLELLPTAKVSGDIKVGSLTVCDGAVFNGNCDVLGEAE